MSDQEIICTFMGWATEGDGWEEWLGLDALWEVEQRLTGEQWQAYAVELSKVAGLISIRSTLHATPEQKIKALAAVLRPIVERA